MPVGHDRLLSHERTGLFLYSGNTLHQIGQTDENYRGVQPLNSTTLICQKINPVSKGIYYSMVDLELEAEITTIQNIESRIAFDVVPVVLDDCHFCLWKR